VAPTRALHPRLGTDPIAIAAPAGAFGVFCLDMATSTVPRGRIEVAARRGERLPIGWAIGRDGRPTDSPESALEGALLPLGGLEHTGGYKGYGLALAVDILPGVLASAGCGPHILGLFTIQGPSDLGHAFWVLDPETVGDAGAFEARVEDYLRTLASSETAPDAPGRVLIPGEPETDAERRADESGIIIDRRHYEALEALGQRFGVPFDARIDVS